MTQNIIANLTSEELAAERLFFLDMLHGSATHETPVWHGRYAVAVLMWTLYDLEPTQADIPYSTFELEQVQRMIDRSPEHMRPILQPKANAMRQLALKKQEDVERNRTVGYRPHYS